MASLDCAFLTYWFQVLRPLFVLAFLLNLRFLKINTEIQKHVNTYSVDKYSVNNASAHTSHPPPFPHFIHQSYFWQCKTTSLKHYIKSDQVQRWGGVLYLFNRQCISYIFGNKLTGLKIDWHMMWRTICILSVFYVCTGGMHKSLLEQLQTPSSLIFYINKQEVL